MITFKDLVFRYDNGVVYARFNFDNNYGISVVHGPNFYCDKDTYEVAVLRNNCLYYDTPITDDVLGYQTPEDIDKIMTELQSYKKNEY